MQTFDPLLHVLETSFTSNCHYTDPIRDVSLSATFTNPNGAEVIVPAFLGRRRHLAGALFATSRG